MQASQQKGTFFGGAMVLAVGIAVVKVIGALYKIPIANILGDEGTGHFSNAYVIYNLLLMISTAGLPIALSKTISEANTLGWKNQVNRIFKVSLVTFFILGLLSFVVMYYFAYDLARWQGDALAATAVKALAPACFFVCVISAFRGFAQGHSNMIPTSISQIIEAFFKLIFGVSLAWYLMNIQAGTQNAAAGAILGVTIGAGVALVYLIIDYKRRNRRQTVEIHHDKAEPVAVILKRLFVIAVPITIGASVVPVTTWLDTYQVQNILRMVTDSQSAEYYKAMEMVDPVVSSYGAYQKAINVFNLPASFMVALTASIIPAVSACWTKNDHVGVWRISESSLRLGALLALPAGVGLTVLASPIMGLLYYDTDRAVSDPCMMILGIASIFVSLMFICNAILQASGFFKLPIVIMTIGCIVKLVTNNYLVRQPEVGIIGAPIGTLACYFVVAVLQLYYIRKLLPQKPNYIRVFVKPLIASVLMGGAAWATYGITVKLMLMQGMFAVSSEGIATSVTSMGNMIATLLAIMIAVIIYALLVVLMRVLSIEDLKLMPKGEKIAKILKIYE